MPRVLLFATHPFSSNGYSKVAFELAKHLSTKDDLQLTYYGFQNFASDARSSHARARTLASSVQVYDAVAGAAVRNQGFGFDEIEQFVVLNKPDVVVIYNDMVVVSNVIERLRKVPDAAFKICVYMDQVYPSQKKAYVDRLNKEADFVICFSEYWQKVIVDQGLKVPTGVLEHGFDPSMHYPIPRDLARTYFNMKKDDFVIMNANRNQPRKRLDVMMMAFAEFVSRHLDDPVKLLIATSTKGAWDLLEIYERELMLRHVTLEEGMRHLVMIDNPQMLSDEDMNILYNTADVCINTAMGEGWGLCNFEAAGMGIPNIVPKVGGFRTIFDAQSAILVEPKYRMYTDMTVDGCPGCAEICDYHDFTEAMERYYADSDLRKSHGAASRRNILQNYRWKNLGDKLYDHIKSIAPKPKLSPPLTIGEIAIAGKKVDPAATPQDPAPAPTTAVDRESLRRRLREKISARKPNRQKF